MPVNFAWQDDDTIFIAVFSGYVTSQNFIAVLTEFIDQLDAANQPLNVVSDYSLATHLPFVGDFMLLALKMLRHPNTGWITVVGGNAILRLWISLFHKLVPLRVAQFETIDEALQFIREQGATHNASR